MKKISKKKLARIHGGLRQIDLAGKVGVSPGQISLYESEDRSPSSELAVKLNNVLGQKVYDETGKRE